MKKKLKKVGAVLTASAVVMTSIFTIAPAKMVKGADEETPSFVVEKDPYVISEEDAQPYDTADLKLTPGLTYVKDGKEIEVTGAIDTQSFCADPTCMEVDGKIYVYGTTDQRSYVTKTNDKGEVIETSNNKEDGPVTVNKYQTKKLSIFSSSDLVNWTDEGFIDMEKVFSDDGKPASSSWAWNSWAPTALKYDCDGDGKDEYYIFFTNGGDVGYVKGETPTGPWKDELGKLLIKKSEIPNGMGTGIIWNFDPAVLLDKKGDVYIYWGGGNGNTPELQKHPKSSRSCKLIISEDKVEMDWSTLTELDSYYHFEDNEINQFGDKYVYTYCANWNVTPQGKPNPYIKDGNASIVGYVSDDPLKVTSDPENWQEGDPKFIGKILKNPGDELYKEYYNNHHHMFEFKDKYYILYHTTALDQFLYKDDYAKQIGSDEKPLKSLSYRNLHIDEIEVDVESDEPTIDVKPSYAGPEQVGTFNPYQTINATTQSHQGGISTAKLEDGRVVLDKIDTGDWTRIDGVDFGSNSTMNIKIDASVASTTTQGSIEVYLDEALTGTKIATIPLKETGADNYETLSADFGNITGVHDVYFVFRGTDYRVASWTFSQVPPAPETPAPTPAPTPTATPAPTPTVTPSVDKVTVAKPTIKSVKNVKGKKAKVTLKKKIKGANGYEIRYSLKKTMKSAKKATIKKANTLKVTISKLKKSKTYYFQARAFKTVNGKKYYSSWSGKKNVKIKK